MNTLEHTAGNAFTRDPDYAAFSGQVVHTFNTVYYDPKEKVFIKRTVEYIDVGRPDTITPVDCEKAMEPDPWESEVSTDAAIRVNLANSAKYRAMLHKEIAAYLKQHGPMRCVDISRGLKLANSTVSKHLLEQEGKIYVRDWKTWGLVGVHDK